MFRELQDVPEGSPKFTRQRDRIVERCLPLADHIARRFDGRATTWSRLRGLVWSTP
jgi:RNA polymerase sigma-B factor